jgi:hypothetical protein
LKSNGGRDKILVRYVAGKEKFFGREREVGFISSEAGTLRTASVAGAERQGGCATVQTEVRFWTQANTNERVAEPVTVQVKGRLSHS